MTKSTSTTDGGTAPLWAFVLFAVVTSAVGIGMFTIRHFAIRDSQAARHWVETPCTIEKSEFVRGEYHDDQQDRPSLNMVYRYDFDGQTYRGDRLDLLIGSMGDDDAWEKRIFEQYPPGSRAVCYVDPDDPTNSVFDRDNAMTKTRNLWLLAFPFLCMGCGFTLAVVTSLVGSVARPRTDMAKLAARGWGELPSPPPRKVSLLQRAVVMSGPLGSQMAWLFVVGFTFVFTILDGPRQYAQLIWPVERDGTAIGEVTAVRRLDSRELYVSLYEYDVAYDVDGTRYTTTSVTRGQKYDQGDQVDVTFPAGEPKRGLIAEAREGDFQWWHGAIPLGVLALLGLGLVGMFWNNFRVVRLLSRGEVAAARWTEQHVAGAIEAADDPTKTGYEVPTASTNYRFEVLGFAYNANSYGPAPQRDLRAVRKAARRAKRQAKQGGGQQGRAEGGNDDQPPLDEMTVLYHPRRPRRNVLLCGYLADVMHGRLSLGDMLLNCAPAPLAALAIWLLFTVD